MLPKLDTWFTKLFRERKRHFALQGYRGRELYEQLARDRELDTEITHEDAALLLDVSTEVLRNRRKKGLPPRYTRRSSGRVMYDLADVIDIIVAGIVEPTNEFADAVGPRRKAKPAITREPADGSAQEAA